LLAARHVGAAPVGEDDAAAPPAHPLNPAHQARFNLKGPVERYLSGITNQWLIPAPSANPAILAMFSDRDRKPYRDLLPWSGEFAGKYLTGATQVLQVNDDTVLRRNLEIFVEAFLKQQDADGYLGPFPKESRLTGSAPNIGGKPGGTWDAWGHYHAMIGLMLWDAAVDDPAALEGARRIGDLLCKRFLGDQRPRLVDTGSTEMNLAPAHALCLLYEKTGTRQYLDLARQLVDEFAAVDEQGKPLAGDYLRKGLAGEEFYRLPKPRWESLHPVLALSELARITGEEKYARAFANLWWSIVRLDRHNNGGFSSGEQAQGNPYHPGAIETCCTIAWMTMTVEMLRQTGDSIVADELELSTLNSALGLFSPTGRWSTYNTPMDGDRKANFHDIVFQARPGSPELNCCSVNAARGIGLLSQWALMSGSRGDDLVLNWYGPGRLSARLASGTLVAFESKTEYPRSGNVRILVEPEHSQSFTLRLRIPHWSSTTTAKVNGQSLDAVKPGSYLEVSRAWKSGDVVELSLDLTPHVWVGERECAGRASVYRGPILLTYDPRLNPGKPADPMSLDATRLDLRPISPPIPHAPIVAVEASTSAGPIVLCDFASAGFDGSRYRSWLRIRKAEPIAFSRAHPWRSYR
jgi:DUF1680 family protein